MSKRDPGGLTAGELEQIRALFTLQAPDMVDEMMEIIRARVPWPGVSEAEQAERAPRPQASDGLAVADAAVFVAVRMSAYSYRVEDARGLHAGFVEGVGQASAGEDTSLWAGSSLKQVRKALADYVAYMRADWSFREHVDEVRLVAPSRSEPFVLTQSELAGVSAEEVRERYFAQPWDSHGVLRRVWLGSGEPVVEEGPVQLEPMAEDEFWELVESAGATASSRVKRLEALAARMPQSRLDAFRERLAQVMWQLDREELCARWQQGWLDMDGFAYARAAVILSGRAKTAELLTGLGKRRSFSDTALGAGERLMLLGFIESERRGIQEVETSVSMESMSNVAAWPGDAMVREWPGWVAGRFVLGDEAGSGARVLELGVAVGSRAEFPVAQQHLLDAAAGQWSGFTVLGYEVVEPESTLWPFTPRAAFPMVAVLGSGTDAPPPYAEWRARQQELVPLGEQPFTID